MKTILGLMLIFFMCLFFIFAMLKVTGVELRKNKD